MNERVRAALAQLEEAREALLEFADDVWAGIDHRDTERVTAGVAFVREYDDKVAALARLTDEIERMIQTWNGRSPATAASESVHVEQLGSSHADGPFGNRPPHRLSEGVEGRFQGIEPVGFTLGDKGFPADTWVIAYVTLCRDLYRRDQARFQRMVDGRLYGGRVKSPYFSRDRSRMVEPHLIEDGIYARLKAGANEVCRRMLMLLRLYEIPPSEIAVYLKHEPR